MSTMPTSTAIRALAAAVRDGELTTVWRENLVTLLHNIATAVTRLLYAGEDQDCGETHMPPTVTATMTRKG